MLENWIISGVVSRKRFKNARNAEHESNNIRILHGFLFVCSELSTCMKHGFYNTYNVTER